MNGADAELTIRAVLFVIGADAELTIDELEMIEGLTVEGFKLTECLTVEIIVLLTVDGFELVINELAVLLTDELTELTWLEGLDELLIDAVLLT